MASILIAIGTLCTFNYANDGSSESLKCHKYYAECIGDLSPLRVNEVKAAEKLRQCIIKK